MARIVQRKASPPYLLIIFVMLFVVAAVLAAVFHSHFNDAEVKLTAAVAERDKVVVERDKLANVVVPGLVQKITGQNLTFEQAIDKAENSLKAEYITNASAGLSDVIKSLNTQVGTHLRKISELEANAKLLNENLAKKDDTYNKLKTEMDGKIDSLNKQIAAEKAKFQADLKSKDDQLARANNEKDAIIKDWADRFGVLSKTSEEQRVKTNELKNRIGVLEKIIADLKGPVGKPEWAMRKADGKVAKALVDQGICYINLGEKDQIKPGLSFAVYSPQMGISDTGEGKAKIVVTIVNPNTSECRILESKKDDPVVEGDIIANLVYNTARPQKFVVIGDFDLYNEGKTNPQGNRRIRDLIESFGGRISDDVTIDTDFVVVGEELVMPNKPLDTASVQEQQAYQEQLKRYLKFQQMMDQAKNLRIPILNTSRFLAFSGYVPKKRLTG